MVLLLSTVMFILLSVILCFLLKLFENCVDGLDMEFHIIYVRVRFVVILRILQCGIC